MPTYDYQCKKCKHEFEAFQSITAKALSRCPKCRGKVERLIGRGAGILFKGSGFYQTDYRSSQYKESAKKDKPSGGDSKGAKPATPPKTNPAKKA